jgi:DNA-binding beta-propeller fold protein YncE
VGAAGLALVLAGCAHGTAASPPVPLHAAPEPGLAPPPRVTPAGRLVTLPPGSHPEGMALDARTGVLAVALRDPARVALFAVRTGRLLRLVTVAGAARHLELAGPGGPLLVPGENTDTLTYLALPSGRILARVPTGRQPHDVAVVGSTAVVADEFSNAVTVITGGRVVATLPGPLQPGGAAGTGDVAAVVAVRGRLLYLYTVTAGNARLTATLAAGAGPTHDVAVGGGRVVVADTNGGALLFDQVTGTPRQLAVTRRLGRPYGLAYDPVRHELWVTATADNLLVGYHVGATGLTEVASYPTVQDAYSVAVDPATGRVFVAGVTASVVQIIAP